MVDTLNLVGLHADMHAASPSLEESGATEESVGMVVGLHLDPRHSHSHPASPPPPAPSQQCSSSTGADSAVQPHPPQQHESLMPRMLSSAESQQAALEHVDAELGRSLSGGWRRLLPSHRSQHYAGFIAEARRARNLLPFAQDNSV